MFVFFVWISNLLFGLSVGLFVYKLLFLHKAKKENTLSNEVTLKKLCFCAYWKWCLIGFVIIKVGLVVFTVVNHNY